jgi:hypothetical protein
VKIKPRIEEILGYDAGYNRQLQRWRLGERQLDIAGCEQESEKQRFKGDPHDLIVFEENLRRRSYSICRVTSILNAARSRVLRQVSTCAARGIRTPRPARQTWGRVQLYLPAFAQSAHPNYVTLGGKPEDCDPKQFSQLTNLFLRCAPARGGPEDGEKVLTRFLRSKEYFASERDRQR